ncbi:MAG: hypothetical protein ACXAEU_18555, partial [Candidatus Hodarchaeales archaeon]
MTPKAFDAINITILADDGPRSIHTSYDSDKIDEMVLDEVIIMKLGISGMTAIGMSSNRATNKLHGSLPVPDSDQYQALAYPFTISGELSHDERVKEFGREVIVFLLFHLEQRDLIFHQYSNIEGRIKEL